MSDGANVMHSRGLLEFAIDQGLFDPGAGQPFNFFKAFMRDGPSDAKFNYPRVCSLHYRLAGRTSSCTDASQPAFVTPVEQPALLQPGRRMLGLHDVMGGLRDHYDASQHDPYLHRNPSEAYRPIALLRTSAGHVCRLRRTSPAARGLAAINYVAMGMPLLAPFIPIYAGLPGDALPPELTCAASEPDPQSLFWAGRRLQALVFQDFPALAPGSTAAIQAWEADVEARQRPAMERRYAAAAARGDEAQAAGILAEFTADVVAQASRLLQRLTGQAADALGLPGVPPDQELVAMLDAADRAYSFRFHTSNLDLMTDLSAATIT